MRFTTFLFTLFLLPALASAANPTYQLGVDDTKTVDCTNPTHREPRAGQTLGDVLDPQDIDRVEVVITKGAFTQTVIMMGGCKPVPLDLTGLAPGTYSQIGYTYDKSDPQLVSKASPDAPFDLLPPPLTAPLPPSIIENGSGN